MKCKYCVALGKRSRLTVRESFRTAAGWSPYFDEDGVYHRHDMNMVTTTYTCSNGHSVHETVKPACPSCGSDW